jgi:hypothetical protein
MVLSARQMALGPTHLAKIAREVPQEHQPTHLTSLSDADFEAWAERLTEVLKNAPL